MDPKSLIATGLTAHQASAYALLIELGEVKPAVAAKQLNMTRTNAYKVFDKLVELQLATKNESNKTFVYRATNPIALSAFTSQFRAEATAREEAVNGIMRELLERYQIHSDKPTVTVFTGSSDVAKAYRQQIHLHEDIYFIHTHADIPMMGFETMHDIRTAPGAHGQQRYGIMNIGKGPVNHASHQRGQLTTTLMTKNDYDEPVEWSVTESSLLIVLYATEPHAILIMDKVVAQAFKQLWSLLNVFLQREPQHQRLKPQS
ncbi:MAG: helix-turn-helix domain-containing protein [Candidatus Saccharimonadales bacterium]